MLMRDVISLKNLKLKTESVLSESLVNTTRWWSALLSRIQNVTVTNLDKEAKESERFPQFLKEVIFLGM
jgi:hypothetical protein